MRYKRWYILLCIILCLNCYIQAQPVSKEMAAQITQRHIRKVAPSPSSSSLLFAIDTNKVQTIFYEQRAMLYKVVDSHQWTIVPTDKRLPPILAYSTNASSEDDTEIPPVVQDLLEYYCQVTAFVKDSCPNMPVDSIWAILQSNQYNTQGIIVAPLLGENGTNKISWGQSGPDTIYCERIYNKFCPDWYPASCERTYVGCTAVGIGMVMRYWQWPHTAYIPVSVNKKGDFGSATELHLYDWDMMSNHLISVTDTANVNMVAGFLKDCGYAIHMKYGKDGSGANLKDAKNALQHTFFYSKDMEYHWKSSYTKEKWRNKINADLKNGCPVVYGANSGINEGHTFVVDGVDASGLYHLNLGWNGSYDGYYNLFDLDIGGDTYNLFQDAIFGIRPAPNCAPYSTNGTKTLRYGTGGELSINTTVESGEFGVYYSGTEVRLQPGFHAKQGSTLHVAIQHFPCDGIAPQSLRAPKYHQQEEEEYTSEDVLPSAITISPNPTTGLLNIQTDKAIQSVAVYQLDGQKVTEQTGNTVELYDVSAGIYILHICFTDGSVYIDKVIKAN